MAKRKKFLQYIVVVLLLVGGTLVFSRKTVLIARVDLTAVDKLEKFVFEQMLNESGGVKTTFIDVHYEENNPITAGHTVLSESQGLLLEYARLTNNEEIFLMVFNFLTTHLQLPNGHYRWRISPSLEATETFTATIDDLQIVQQLILARKQWPQLAADLTPAIKVYAENFFTDTTNNGLLINGFDYETKMKTETLFLSYLDFSALELLRSEVDLSEKIQLDDMRKQSLAIIEQSYISDEFPFYYQQFFVETLLIEQQKKINMIESLLIVKHLAEINQVNRQTIRWLEHNIQTDIYAYYDSNGQPITDEQSSAVYALIAQIAAEINNQELYEQAIEKIWQYQIQNSASQLAGALGDERTKTAIAYDQLQTLIATAKIHAIQEEENEKTGE